MGKRIVITDETTGNTDFNEQVDGGYSLQYTVNTDEGSIHIHGRINNGRYGMRHWIKNSEYGPIAEKLVKKFEELNHIEINRILFIEDVLFQAKSGSKSTWAAKVSRANKELFRTWGYLFVIETRQFFIERLTSNQLAALLYHELRHIDPDGGIMKHDVEDWSDMITAFGKDWMDSNSRIGNILADDFEWASTSREQITIYDFKSKSGT